MKAHAVLKAMLDDGAIVELGVFLLPVVLAASILVSYLLG